MPDIKATGIILAGGKNRRLGRNKALEVIGGKTILERVLERLSAVVDRILIVTAAERPELPTAGRAEIITDIYPGYGPLGGIYAGLESSDTLQNIVVACDMPFLSPKLLTYMLSLSNSFDAVVPRLDNGMIEPLHAVYSRNSLERMKKSLEGHSLPVDVFINENLNVRWMEQAETLRIDPEMRSFFNINFQADVERAKNISASESCS